MGAVLQTLLVLTLPRSYAILPPDGILLWRFAQTMLMCYGYIPNTQMEGVIQGKFSALIPTKDGALPAQASQDEVTVILLGARSNQ